MTAWSRSGATRAIRPLSAPQGARRASSRTRRLGRRPDVTAATLLLKLPAGGGPPPVSPGRGPQPWQIRARTKVESDGEVRGGQPWDSSLRSPDLPRSDLDPRGDRLPAT